jgi:hypothetical protein
MDDSVYLELFEEKEREMVSDETTDVPENGVEEERPVAPGSLEITMAPVPKKEYQPTRQERQKKVLQRMTLAEFERGMMHGLTVDEVESLKDALLALGWLPEDVKV